MLRAEESYYTTLTPRTPGCLCPYSEWRASVAQWTFRVSDHYGLNREVAWVSLNLMDRYLVSGDVANMKWAAAVGEEDDDEARTYYIVSVTAMYVASKLDGCGGGGATTTLSSKTIAELSGGQFSAADVECMELRMLSALRWRVHPTTPMVFVNYLVRMFLPLPARSPQDKDVIRPEVIALCALHEIARYLTELLLCVPDLLLPSSFYHNDHISASSSAFACILVALDKLSGPALGDGAREKFLKRARSLSPSLTTNEENIKVLVETLQVSFSTNILLEANKGQGNKIILQAWGEGLLKREASPRPHIIQRASNAPMTQPGLSPHCITQLKRPSREMGGELPSQRKFRRDPANEHTIERKAQIQGRHNATKQTSRAHPKTIEKKLNTDGMHMFHARRENSVEVSSFFTK